MKPETKLKRQEARRKFEEHQELQYENSMSIMSTMNYSGDIAIKLGIIMGRFYDKKYDDKNFIEDLSTLFRKENLKLEKFGEALFEINNILTKLENELNNI